MTISVCFPYRPADKEREENKAWILNRYQTMLPNFELQLGIPDEDRPFNRSQAINNAVRQSSGSILVIADLDIYFNPIHLKDTIQRVQTHGGWGFAFRKYYTSTPKFRNEIVYDNYSDIFLSEQNLEYGVCGSNTLSGQLVIGRNDFIRCGGFDEDFVGWGYEDDAFTVAADRLIAPHFRLEYAFVLHLWHPHANLDPQHHVYEANNKALFAQRYVEDFAPKKWIVND